MTTAKNVTILGDFALKIAWLRKLMPNLLRENIMQTYTHGQRFDFKIGQQVICNGFPGVVRTVYADKLAGMVVVRLASGCLTITLPTESFDLSA